MDNRDDLILAHIGRYTVSIRRIIEDLFFDGASCGNTLDALVKKEFVQRVKGALEGNYSYYQLTPKGAKSLGLPANKAIPKGEAALAQNLAALWFSCKSHYWRKRLADDDLNKLFGAPLGGNTIHVAQNGIDDDTTVFRLFVPSETTGVKKGYAQLLKKTAHKEMEDKRLLPWIERGTYAYAVLVHSLVRKEELEKLIPVVGFPKFRIHVEIAPTPSTMPMFLQREDA
jgi:hypothetical protein